MDGDRNQQLKAFRERAQKILSLDHFAALGVPRTASPDDVQKAFVEAVKTWHPDRVPAGLGEVKPLVAQVFGRLDAARGVLTDPARRLRYIEELDKPAKRASATDVSAAEAGLEFKKAEAFLKRNDTATAEQHLRRAVQLAPGNAEYQALLAWVQVKDTSTPAELERIVADLDRVITLDSAAKRAFFFRGQLRKRLNLAKEAYADFVRASELDPSNIDAQREVRLYKMRHERGAAATAAKSSPPPSSEGVGGFFRKLFKRT
ncbi:MAG TPA: DnaJ domain-containing protein [Labilithrix sp.]|nr:DnaJ domain-containing protein [Labilithrix sp.]